MCFSSYMFVKLLFDFFFYTFDGKDFCEANTNFIINIYDHLLYVIFIISYMRTFSFWNFVYFLRLACFERSRKNFFLLDKKMVYINNAKYMDKLSFWYIGNRWLDISRHYTNTWSILTNKLRVSLLYIRKE